MSSDKDKKTQTGDSDSFASMMTDVTPIDSENKVEPVRKKRKPVPLNLPTGDEDSDTLADLNIETGDFLEFKRDGIQNRVFDDLRRGYIEVESVLDLHGMRVVDARPAMERFLKQSLQKGHRCILVIHGKGQGSKDQQPVLKQKTNQWLRQRDEVLAFSSAPRWNGGTGATTVLLSKKHFY